MCDTENIGGGKRHRYAIIARPDKLGTDGGWLTVYIYMCVDTVAESGVNPASKTRFSLSVENDDEQADTGRDGRTRLARPHYSQARTGTGKYSFFLVQLTRAGPAT